MKILPALAASGVVALAAITLVVGVTFEAREAAGSAKFTQETGKACSFCHAPAPPTLNETGKKFKANGNKL
jgi:hypothetical protein